jgi:hypothetical protein
MNKEKILQGQKIRNAYRAKHDEMHLNVKGDKEIQDGHKQVQKWYVNELNKIGFESIENFETHESMYRYEHPTFDLDECLEKIECDHIRVISLKQGDLIDGFPLVLGYREALLSPNTPPTILAMDEANYMCLSGGESRISNIDLSAMRRKDMQVTRLIEPANGIIYARNIFFTAFFLPHRERARYQKMLLTIAEATLGNMGISSALRSNDILVEGKKIGAGADYNDRIVSFLTIKHDPNEFGEMLTPGIAQNASNITGLTTLLKRNVSFDEVYAAWFKALQSILSVELREENPTKEETERANFLKSRYYPDSSWVQKGGVWQINHKEGLLKPDG